MTTRTRAQLNSDADSALADNTVGAISPEDIRQRVKDLADSALLAEDSGTVFQPHSANLDEYAAVNPTAAGLALLDDADAAAQRTTLGLGSAATQASSAFATAAQGTLADGALQRATEDQTITGGAAVTSKSLGTQSSGTLTLDMGDRPLQHYTNGGAHALAPGTVTGSCLVDITNNGSAGAITTSGWTKVSGDPFTTTNGHKFRCHSSVGNGGSYLVVGALQ